MVVLSELVLLSWCRGHFPAAFGGSASDGGMEECRLLSESLFDLEEDLCGGGVV